jgi:hypothetical protein
VTLIFWITLAHYHKTLLALSYMKRHYLLYNAELITLSMSLFVQAESREIAVFTIIREVSLFIIHEEDLYSNTQLL